MYVLLVHPVAEGDAESAGDQQQQPDHQHGDTRARQRRVCNTETVQSVNFSMICRYMYF